MEDFGIYAIGQQDFRILREDDALYVDKTSFIEKIVGSNTKYYFLARPRRFGKSLFLSTLRYFFEGRPELFKGLYIDSTERGYCKKMSFSLVKTRTRFHCTNQYDLCFELHTDYRR